MPTTDHEGVHEGLVAEFQRWYGEAPRSAVHLGWHDEAGAAATVGPDPFPTTEGSPPADVLCIDLRDAERGDIDEIDEHLDRVRLVYAELGLLPAGEGRAGTEEMVAHLRARGFLFADVPFPGRDRFGAVFLASRGRARRSLRLRLRDAFYRLSLRSARKPGITLPVSPRNVLRFVQVRIPRVLVRPLPPVRWLVRSFAPRLLPRRERRRLRSGESKRKGIGTLRLWYIESLPMDPLSREADRPPIEVFIPCGPKDVDAVPSCVAGLRHGVSNPVERVVVATPRAHVPVVEERLKGVAPAQVVADEDVLSDEAQSALSALAEYPRAQWVAQQFVKLDWVMASAAGHVLVLDADLILLRPRVFAAGGRSLLIAANNYQVPYYEHVARVLGAAYAPAPVSFTAHHMLMRPVVARELATAVSLHTGASSFFEGCAREIDRSESSPCSDYDLYGQFAYRTRPGEITLAGFGNVSIPRSRILDPRLDPEEAVACLAGRCPRAWSVGVHHYLEARSSTHP